MIEGEREVVVLHSLCVGVCVETEVIAGGDQINATAVRLGREFGDTADVIIEQSLGAEQVESDFDRVRPLYRGWRASAPVRSR